MVLSLPLAGTHAMKYIAAQTDAPADRPEFVVKMELLDVYMIPPENLPIQNVHGALTLDAVVVDLQAGELRPVPLARPVVLEIRHATFKVGQDVVPWKETLPMPMEPVIRIAMLDGSRAVPRPILDVK